MFIIPLGIPEKIRSIPWGSIAIALSICAFSIHQFKSDPLKTRRNREIASESGFMTEFDKFLKENCTFKDSREQRKCTSELTALIRKESPELQKKKGYAEYLAARSKYTALNKIEAYKNGELLRGNHNINTSIKALFSHAGYMHLISNMIVFLLFAVTLEQTLGFLGVFVIFIVGGIVSNIIQLPFLPEGVKLLGASGGVSAIIGAFAVTYWREKITAIVSFFFVLNKKVQLPCLLYILLFFVISEFTGLLNANSNVAHISHLSGLSAGAIISYVLQEFYTPNKKEHHT